jgi:hypothetical protein
MRDQEFTPHALSKRDRIDGNITLSPSPSLNAAFMTDWAAPGDYLANGVSGGFH